MSEQAALPIICIEAEGLEQSGLNAVQRQWAGSSGFSGQLGRLLALPAPEGRLSGYAFGLGGEGERSPLVLGLAAAALNPGRYRLAGAFGDPTLAALAFRLGAYRFERYRTAREPVLLDMPGDAAHPEVDRLFEGARLARDLINTPANDLGPVAFEREIAAFATSHSMSVRAIIGDDLLAQNFPMIHAVGRASAEAPRLLDLGWGQEGDPRLTLVGKGVTFDTGGLDIKTAAGMLLMKKDMGGAANVLGLAHAIIDARLKVRLRVLIPVVENAISGSAFRPGDVLPSRAGISVEISNTDAEGRLILADALALADEESPDLIIDMATLTGAARTALGPDLPALYCTDDTLARQMMEQGLYWGDPVWQMPLWAGYDSMLASKIAEVNHASGSPFAGSITAALFLKRFVTNAKAWAHFDIMAWAPEPRPGRPFGGTDHAMRACYGMLKSRYGG